MIVHDYCDQLDNVHMSEHLKLRIHEQLNDADMKSSRKRTWCFCYAALLMMIIIALSSFLYMRSQNSGSHTLVRDLQRTPIQEPVQADDGKRQYTPIADGMIDSAGPDVSQHTLQGPDSTSLYELPIYRYRYIWDAKSLSFQHDDQQALSRKFQSYANKLGLKVKKNQISFEDEHTSMYFASNTTLSIDINTKAKHEQKLSLNQWKADAIKRFKSIIPFKNPVYELNDRTLYIYEKASNREETFIRYYTDCIEITPSYTYINDTAKMELHYLIKINDANHLEHIKNIPIIDEQQAISLLLRGGYYYEKSVYDEQLNDIRMDQIISSQLVYKHSTTYSKLYPYILPVYRFQVNIHNQQRSLDVLAVPQSVLTTLNDVTWYFQEQ